MRTYQCKAFCILLMLVMAGCAATNRSAQLTNAANTYAATVESLSVMADAGQLSNEDIGRIEPYRQVARAALDEMRRANDSGDETAWSLNWTTFNNALDFVATFLEE